MRWTKRDSDGGQGGSHGEILARVRAAITTAI